MYNILFSRLSGLWDKDFLVGSFLPALLLLGAISVSLGISFGWLGSLSWIESWTAIQLAIYSTIGFSALVLVAYSFNGLRELLIDFWRGDRQKLRLLNLLLVLDVLQWLERRRLDRIYAKYRNSRDALEDIERLLRDPEEWLRSIKASAQEPSGDASQRNLGNYIRKTTWLPFHGFLREVIDNRTLHETFEAISELSGRPHHTAKEILRFLDVVKRGIQSNSHAAVMSMFHEEKVVDWIWPWRDVMQDEVAWHERRLLAEGLLFADPQPTRLGNIIRSYNAYPLRRYGLEGEANWPRLRYVMTKDPSGSSFFEGVKDRRLALDFTITMGTACVLYAIFVIAAIVTNVAPAQWAIWALALALLVAWLFYRAAIVAALSLGETVRAAFDMFRLKLLGEMLTDRDSKALPKDIKTAQFEDERQAWTSLLRGSYGQDLVRMTRGAMKSRLRDHSRAVRLALRFGQNPLAPILIVGIIAIVIVFREQVTSFGWISRYAVDWGHTWQVVASKDLPPDTVVEKEMLGTSFALALLPGRPAHMAGDKCVRASDPVFVNPTLLIGLQVTRPLAPGCAVVSGDVAVSKKVVANPPPAVGANQRMSGTLNVVLSDARLPQDTLIGMMAGALLPNHHAVWFKTCHVEPMTVAEMVATAKAPLAEVSLVNCRAVMSNDMQVSGPRLRPDLKWLANELKLTNDIVHLIGHADYPGTEELNNELARNRAERLKEILVAHGISSKRLLIRFDGERNPLFRVQVGNDPQWGVLINRRVDIFFGERKLR